MAIETQTVMCVTDYRNPSDVKIKQDLAQDHAIDTSPETEVGIAEEIGILEEDEEVGMIVTDVVVGEIGRIQGTEESGTREV